MFVKIRNFLKEKKKEKTHYAKLQLEFANWKI